MTLFSARPVVSNGIAWRHWLRRGLCLSLSSSAGAANRADGRVTAARRARERERSGLKSTPSGARSNSNALGDSAESLVANTTPHPLHGEPARIMRERAKV